MTDAKKLPRRNNLPFDPAMLFVALADGQPITCLRAAIHVEALAYLARLEKLGLVSTLKLDEARFNVGLTQKGLAFFDRVVTKMYVTAEKVRPVEKPQQKPKAKPRRPSA